MYPILRLWTTLFAVLGVIWVFESGAVSAETCAPEWSRQFAEWSLPGTVEDVIVFDPDGDGPAAGELIAAFGDAFALPNRTALARWTGFEWSFFGSLVDGNGAYALHVFDDDGPGPVRPALYVGGSFRGIEGIPAEGLAKWDGESWSEVGGSVRSGASQAGDVRDFVEFDEGGPGPAPPALVVVGRFDEIGRKNLDEATDVGNVAKWDGSRWSTFGTGVNRSDCAAVFDADGDGPDAAALYVGSAGFGGIRKWNGVDWSLVPETDGSQFFNSLVVFDPDGDGPLPTRLTAGGRFFVLDGAARNVAQWDGTSWSALGDPSELDERVRRLFVFDADGDGQEAPQLYAGGDFTNHIARWDGTHWVNPSKDFLLSEGLNGSVRALGSFVPSGSDPRRARLVVGGSFTTIEGTQPFTYFTSNNIIQWDGSTWITFGLAPTRLTYSVAMFDEDQDGPGPPRLFLGGGFAVIGDAGFVYRIARWDGSTWSSVGGGLKVGADLPYVTSMLVYDPDQDGPQTPGLYVGGHFAFAGESGEVVVNSIARWDGMSWSDLHGGFGTHSRVHAMIAFDDDGEGPAPPSLFAVANVTRDDFQNGIFRWDGQHWSNVADVIPSPDVRFVVFDSDAAGPKGHSLYAGISKGPSPLWRWDGIAFVPEPGPLGGTILSLAVFDEDGAGPERAALFVGGGLTLPDTTGNVHLVKWDGLTWTDMEVHQSWGVTALAVHDSDVEGPEPPSLYVAGPRFIGHTDPPLVFNNLVRWDGTRWWDVGGGIPVPQLGQPNPVNGLFSVDEDGPGPAAPALWITGEFETVGDGISSVNLAKWTRSTPTADADQDEDVDDRDFARFFGCLNAEASAKSCCPFDVNFDSVVGLRDFAAFQNAYTDDQ